MPLDLGLWISGSPQNTREGWCLGRRGGPRDSLDKGCPWLKSSNETNPNDSDSDWQKLYSETCLEIAAVKHQQNYSWQMHGPGFQWNWTCLQWLERPAFHVQWGDLKIGFTVTLNWSDSCGNTIFLERINCHASLSWETSFFFLLKGL